ncbi:MAG: site-specific integrase, partial [Endomicrobium sp.]|nr:site-specific integrase [Endomicrobium sp.]
MIDLKKTIGDFISYIIVEKGLAKNTALAYRTDLYKFAAFCEEKNIPADEFKHHDITDFLWEIKMKGLKPRSIYRMMESIRQFYKFLNSEELVENNPTSYLAAPKIPENLPGMLSFEEVTALLNSVNGADEMNVR